MSGGNGYGNPSQIADAVRQGAVREHSRADVPLELDERLEELRPLAGAVWFLMFIYPP